ncbi:MAG: ankyrin repeat domain-containing protein [Cyanobacteria bacterium P01_E01_bin.42]
MKIENKSREIPIHNAARAGDLQALTTLLDRNPLDAITKGSCDRLPLYSAVEGGSVECAKLLIEWTIELRSHGLIDFSENTNLDAVPSEVRPNRFNRLLQRLFDRNSRHQKVVDTLDSVYRQTPLFGAIIHDNRECAQLLLSYGANPHIKDKHSRTPLFFVKSLAMLLLLKQYGVDLNSSENKSTLELIAWHSLELLKFGIDRGIEINRIPDRYNKPLLHTAVIQMNPAERLEGVKLLLDSGADPNLIGWYEGYSVLHFAVSRKREDVVRLLLDRGANPNLQDYWGDTPLHLAIQEEETALVQLLIEYDADVNIRNAYRRSPWDCARELPEILELLEPHWLDLPNPRPTPQQLTERILAIPRYCQNGLVPCSEAEIAHLEQKFDVILPETYKQFLRIMGRSAGGFLSSEHWEGFYWYVERLAQPEKYEPKTPNAWRPWVPVQLPEKHFVCAERGESGAYFFFIADGQDDDPPLYYFGDETEDNLKKQYDSFWDWIEVMVVASEYYHKKKII